MYYLGLLALALMTATCAKVIGPPGGPEDKTPPTILSAVPHSHQINVPAGNTFTVIFSENINPTSINKQFFVSPRQVIPPKLKLHGAELEVIFADNFALDKTYVITIGSGLRDMRGNQLGASKSFAFTRGEAIDTSFIAGSVTDGDSPASGVGVGLFRKFMPSAMGDMDSLYPDYYTVSGSDGGFELAFLPADDYFILAFRDKDKNQLFQYGAEDFGVTSRELHIGSDSYANLELRMQQRDTSAITIISATFNADGFLRVNLSRKLNPALFFGRLEKVRIVNVNDSSLVISPFAMKNEHGASSKRIELLFEDFPTGEYLLAIDFAALYSDDRELAEQFIGLNHSEVEDAQKPTLQSRLVPSRIAPWEALRWVYSFSETVIVDSISNNGKVAISISDSRQGAMDYVIDSVSSFEMAIEATTRPVKGERYLLRMKSVVDLSSNELADTLISDSIDVWPTDSLGSLSLSVENRFDSLFEDEFLLRMTRLGGREYWTNVSVAETTKVELPAGDYIIEAMVDSSSLALGSLYPLRFTLPRGFYPDTVNVRPRFDTKGVRIIIE